MQEALIVTEKLIFLLSKRNLEQESTEHWAAGNLEIFPLR